MLLEFSRVHCYDCRTPFEIHSPAAVNRPIVFLRQPIFRTREIRNIKLPHRFDESPSCCAKSNITTSAASKRIQYQNEAYRAPISTRLLRKPRFHQTMLNLLFRLMNVKFRNRVSVSLLLQKELELLKWWLWCCRFISAMKTVSVETLMSDLLRNSGGVAVIDGGLATELEHYGADLNDPLWSAKCLLNSVHLIRQVHLDYLEAGADIIITTSYQATIQGFEAKGYSSEDGENMLKRSVEMHLKPEMS